MEKILKDFLVPGFKGLEMITESCLFSEEDFFRLARLSGERSFSFITQVSEDLPWVRKEVDRVLDLIDSDGESCLCEPETICMTVCVSVSFDSQQTKEGKNTEAGLEDAKIVPEQIYLHIYQNDEEMYRLHQVLQAKLTEIRDLYQKGKIPDKTDVQQFPGKFFRIRKKTSGGVEITLDKKAIQEEKRYHGVLVLAASREQDADRALEKFRKRKWLEDFFDSSSGIDRDPVTWLDHASDGERLIQFVALCYYEYFSKKIRELTDSLGKEAAGNGPTDKKISDREAELDYWLTENPIWDILSWFDALEKREAGTAYAKKCWNKRTMERDRMFLERLGMDLS